MPKSKSTKVVFHKISKKKADALLKQHLKIKKRMQEYQFDKFYQRLTKKMARGAEEHKHKIPPMEKLIDEIEDELLDVCGWGYLLYQKLEKTRGKIKQLVARDRLELTSSEGVFLNPYLTPKAKSDFIKKFQNGFHAGDLKGNFLVSGIDVIEKRNGKKIVVKPHPPFLRKMRKDMKLSQKSIVVGRVVDKNKVRICGHDTSVKPIQFDKFSIGEEVRIKSCKQLLKEFGKGTTEEIAFGDAKIIIFADAKKFCGQTAIIKRHSYANRWFIEGYDWSFPEEAFIKIRQEKRLPRAKSICADSKK